jgi:hypothetical protein
MIIVCSIVVGILVAWPAYRILFYDSSDFWDGCGKKAFTLVASLILFTAGLLTVRADTFMMHFQIAGFAVSNGNPPPTDPVTGTIVWEATGIHDTIQSFDSINLTLDAHNYSIWEIGLLDFGSFAVEIGGTTNGAGGVVNSTDDFFIQWDKIVLRPYFFTYTSERLSGIWQATTENFSAFSITQVPEPSTVSLVALALLGTGAWRLRQRTPRQAKESTSMPNFSLWHKIMRLVSLMTFMVALASQAQTNLFFLPCGTNASVSFEGITQEGPGTHRLEVRRLAYAPDGSKEAWAAFTSCVIYYGDEPSILAVLDECLDPFVRRVSKDRIEIYFLAGAHSHFRQRWKLLGYSAKLEKQDAIEWSEDPRNAEPKRGANRRQPTRSKTNSAPSAAAPGRSP